MSLLYQKKGGNFSLGRIIVCSIWTCHFQSRNFRNVYEEKKTFETKLDGVRWKNEQ